MKKLLYTLIFTPLFVFGQKHSCGYEKAVENESKFNPAYLKNIETQNLQISEVIKNQVNFKASQQLYVVPVVVHVLHNGEAIGSGSNISDAQIMSGLNQLNSAFRNVDGKSIDTYIQFELAKQDPNCNATTGINRIDASGVSGYSTDGLKLQSSGADEITLKALSKWSNELYYNIWIVSEIDGNNGGGGYQGFAYFPGVNSEKDGIVVMHTAWGSLGTVNSWNNQGKTIIHEMGHALNLYHTFEGDNSGGSCPAETNGCGNGKGDCCADTPPHIRSASDCPSGTNSCTGQPVNLEVHNYMDYSAQDCQYLFTSDQVARMRAALETQRSSLINNKALDLPVSFNNPENSACIPSTGSQGLSNYYCGILNIKLADVNYKSDYANIDNGYVDYTGNCLRVVTIDDNVSSDLEITVGLNTNYVRAWIDYNNDGSFNNGNELIYDGTLGADATGKVSFTPISGAVKNTNLRMRVMADLTPFTSACYNPTYGQAEDINIVINQTNPSALPQANFTIPSSEILVGSTVQLTDLSTNTTSWNWEITGPENFSFTDQNPSITFNKTGVYTIKLTAQNANGKDEVIKYGYILVKTTLGTDDIESNSNVVVYPNPFTDDFNIKLPDNLGSNSILTLMDVSGKIILQHNVAQQQNGVLTVSSSNYTSGVYFLNIKDGSKMMNTRIIKR